MAKKKSEKSQKNLKLIHGEAGTKGKAKSPESAETSLASKANESLLKHGAQVAEECGASAIFVYSDALPEGDVLEELLSDTDVYYVTKTEEEAAAIKERGIETLKVPNVALTRLGQIKMAVLCALAREIITPDDVIVCLSGIAESGTLDTLVVMSVGKEFEMFVSPQDAEAEESDILPEVLERVVDIAAELGSEGREGKPIGTIFVVGDTEKVLPLTKQLIFNPFKGYSEEERNVIDPTLEETIKELAGIDGAFIVTNDGVIESAGTYLKTSGVSEEVLPQGLGARHQAAAAITDVTNCIAVTVSASTGTVTIFRNGQIVTEIEKPRHSHPSKAKRSDS